MQKYKVSDYSLIIFMVFTNIVLLNTFGFDILLNNFSQSSWNALLIIALVFFLIAFFFKGFSNKVIPLKIVAKNKFIKIITLTYLLLNCAILVVVSSMLLKHYFYVLTPIYIFIFITIIVALIVSMQNFTTIISSAFIPLVIMSFFYIVPLFFMSERDFSLLIPIDIDYSKLPVTILLLTYPFDSILYSFYSPQMKNGFSRKTLVISNFILLLYFLFIIIDSITLMGANFFKETIFSGFYHWQYFRGNRFLENFNIFLLIGITLTSIFRLGLCLNLCRLLISIPRKTKYIAILGAILSILTIFIYFSRDFLFNNLILISSGMLILIIIVFAYLVLKSWEFKHE